MNRIQKFGIAGGVLFVVGILFGWVMFPMLMKSMLHKQVRLKPGSDFRGMWAKFPFGLDFKIYIFNVTNPDAVTAGEKPIVKEIGPFYYEEWKEKVDLVDREEDDTVDYAMRDAWYFKPEKGLTGEEELVIPNLFMLSAVMKTMREKPGVISLASKAMDSIFKKPTSMFIKIKAKDFLFDGIPIDCTVTDFAGGAVCSLLKQDPAGLMPNGEDKYLFSIFGPKNYTVTKSRLRVFRGMKISNDVGVVTEFNGEPKMSVWDDERCDSFNGTDGTVFHPYFPREEDIVSFAPDLCRSLSAFYESPSKIKGIKTNRYTADLGDMSTDPLLKCYCPTPDTCLKKGVMDLYRCVGVPLIATFPHFFNVDDSYMQTVDGLSPSKDEHAIVLDMEPLTGTPVHAKKRLQFNMFIYPIEKYKIMKTLPRALLPLFWIEEGVTLPDDFIKELKKAFTMITIVSVLKWLMVLGGLGLGGAAGGLFYKQSRDANKLNVTKVLPGIDKAASGGGEKQWPMNISTVQGAQVPANLDNN